MLSVTCLSSLGIDPQRLQVSCVEIHNSDFVVVLLAKLTIVFIFAHPVTSLKFVVVSSICGFYSFSNLPPF